MIQVFKNFPRCMFSLEIGLHSHFNTWGSSRVLQHIKSCLILNSVNPHMCPDHDPKSLLPQRLTPLTYCRGSNQVFLSSLWNPVETPYDRYGEGNGGLWWARFTFCWTGVQPSQPWKDCSSISVSSKAARRLTGTTRFKECSRSASLKAAQNPS